MNSYQAATSAAERTEAIDLVQEIYLAEGYITEIRKDQTENHYLHTPKATTILCRKEHTLVGTISLIEDTGDNLPMAQIFTPELDELRKTKHKIAEVCQFAVRKTGSENNLDVSLGLLSHTIHLALQRGIDYLCFAINPKHQLFYRGLGAKQIGPLKLYPFVNDAPALAFYLDLTDIESTAHTDAHSGILQKILDQTPAQSFFATTKQ